MKPANVRFYFDADVLGLAQVVAAQRPDVTFPGDEGGVVHKRERPPCFITSPTVADDVWIPEVASRGLLIITRDRHIQSRPLELAAVHEHGARMVTLAGRDAGTVWAQLELLMIRWRNIEALTGPGPFIFQATRSTFRPVPLRSRMSP